MEYLNETEVTEFIFLAFSGFCSHPVLLFVVFLFLYLFIICGNILMLLIIKQDSRLHTPMYLLVSILSCSYVCYFTTIIPQTLYNLLARIPSILYYNCATQMFFCNVFGEVELLIVIVMAYDRYVAISNPLRYKIIMSRDTCLTLLGLSLLFSGIVAFVFVYVLFRLPFCRPPLVNHFYCDLGEILLLACYNHRFFYAAAATAYLLGMGVITIPIIIMFLNYIYIISAVLKIRTTEGRQKAFSTCSSHITIVVVELGCLWFIYFRPAETYYLDKDKAFVMAYTYLTPILNPVIYTVRNKAMYEGFKKLFSLKLL